MKSHVRIINSEPPKPINKVCVFDHAINCGDTPMATQIIADLKKKNPVSVKIELRGLALDLGKLYSISKIYNKNVMELIIGYHLNNKQIFQVMGEQEGCPFEGIYDKTTNSTSFNLEKFPDGLLIILNEYVQIVKERTNATY